MQIWFVFIGSESQQQHRPRFRPRLGLRCQWRRFLPSQHQRRRSGRRKRRWFKRWRWKHGRRRSAVSGSGPPFPPFWGVNQSNLCTSVACLARTCALRFVYSRFVYTYLWKFEHPLRLFQKYYPNIQSRSLHFDRFLSHFTASLVLVLHRSTF